MKIYFLGSLINDTTFDEIVKKSKYKPSNSAQNFENMLVKGLLHAGAEVEVHSVPAVGVYPGGSLLGWGRRKESLSSGGFVRWLPLINFPVIKQLCMSISTYCSLGFWLIKNRKDKNKAVLSYSVCPNYSFPQVRLCKLFSCLSSVIITDLPAYLYKLRKNKGLKNLLANFYTNKLLKVQKRFDCYILLTKYMAKAMGIEEKPAMIAEGFSDEDIFKGLPFDKKNGKKTVMYAGALNKSFGILKLLDGFMKTKGAYELWLYGAGDSEAYIKECAKKDSRITYFGKVDRKDLLLAQMKAHLLISVKPSDEDHTNFAFPSKILEYMTSGTPVLSTRVGGIPDEYFDFVYPIEDETEEGIAKSIEEILILDEEKLKEQGEKTKCFAVEHKNCFMQAQRIHDFLSNLSLCRGKGW